MSFKIQALEPVSAHGALGRRMAEGAALLVDHVLPAFGYRQWVLLFVGSMAVRLRYDQSLLATVAETPARTRRVRASAAATWVGVGGEPRHPELDAGGAQAPPELREHQVTANDRAALEIRGRSCGR
ncbi:hypothetical protein [Nannocystis sp.]|uniref:hypothetical protein n=1 Tax=Nannocystis sp. TaxID=1962667 RepID=UPI0025D9C1D2|nr:hypothetical protein [Nannocystis sp.]MBK7825046.1 hypothetical protein [Nannocystis sp.]